MSAFRSRFPQYVTLALAILSLSAASERAVAQMPHAAAICLDARIADHNDLSAASVPRPIVTTDTILALRRMLRDHRFIALDSAFARYERAAKLDVRNELAWSEANEAFSSPDIRFDEPLRTWIMTTGSVTSRIARAYYRRARGVDARGTASGEHTSDAAFAQMGYLHSLALLDLGPVLKKDSTNLLALALMIDVAKNAGDSLNVMRLARLALATSPASWLIRSQVMSALETRWVGSLKAMESFAKEGAAYEERYPQLRALRGYASMEIGDQLEDADDTPGAIQKYTQALSFGNSPGLRYGRGRLFYQTDRDGAAIADLNCASAFAPARADIIAMRGLARLDLAGDAETTLARSLRRQGKADLKLAMELDPTDSVVLWAVKHVQ